MKKDLNTKFYPLIKQHAILMGDCVLIYDPELDAIIESTDCFDDIVNIVPKTSKVKSRWLAKIQASNDTAKHNLFQLEKTPAQYEYILKNKDGSNHRINQIHYPYTSANGTTLVMIIIRDLDGVPKSIATAKLTIENWRKLASSQLRHMRKIVSAIYERCQASFIMIALPNKDGKTARSLVGIKDGEFFDEITYPLAGTPCEITVTGSLCTHKSNIQTLYPLDTLLVDMAAESYVGVPFFDEHGNVLGYLVIIHRTPINNSAIYNEIIDEYQPRLSRRLQLYIADQHLSEMRKGGFDFSQFSLGSIPSSAEFLQWANLSTETFNSVKEAIFITNAENIIIQINQAFTDITGYSAEEILGKTPNILSSGVHDATFYQQMNDSLAKYGMWEGEIINKTKHNKSFSEWLYIRVVYNHREEVTHYIAVFSDISIHKEKEELLYFQANYDPLTMLPNRSFFFYTLAEKIAQLEDNPKNTLHLLHIDLKGLARINENYNYNTGDALLIEISRRLKRILAVDAILARISGDNFVALITSDDASFAIESLAQTISDALSLPVDTVDYQVKITSNIGIASTQNSQLSIDNFYSMAEQALLKSKLEGPNLFFTYDEVLQNELKIRWELEQELGEAIEKDQFQLYYQPQIESATNVMCGVEALVRWQHPTKGLLSPSQFIPLAEESGQIVPLGNLILEKACRQIKQWAAHVPQRFTTSVNISPRQFALEHSHHTLRNIINQSGIEKSSIILEITEDVLMTEHSYLLEMLNSMRESGIELSLDDFGTGFSSLSYLQHYPLSELKIDQSFVSSLGSKPESHTIVKAIIAMAKGLNLKIVAEGVETELQRNILLSLGCDIFQGFYFAKPMPANELGKFLSQQAVIK